MFGRVWEQIKEHKFVVMVAIAGVVFLVYLRGTGSASQGVASADPNAASDNTLAAAQLQAQTDMAGISAGSQAASEQTAAGSHVADLSYQLQSDANTLNANLASTQMADTLQALSTHDTLSAQVANNQIAAGTAQLQISTAAQTQQTRTLANALVQQATVGAAAATSVAQSKSCSWYNPTCW
jgi:hypothetical protein